jgi:hypothetical protein
MTSRLSRAELSAAERGLRSRITQIASSERFLRGTLSERSSKCGKPNCRCATGAGHTSLYLVQSYDGQVRQVCIPKTLHDPVRRAVGEFQEMQRLLHEVSELEWKRFLARKG